MIRHITKGYSISLCKSLPATTAKATSKKERNRDIKNPKGEAAEGEREAEDEAISQSNEI